MNKAIGEMQNTFLEMSSKLVPVLKKIQSLAQGNKEVIVGRNLEIISIYGKSFADAVRIFGYEEYYSIADEVVKMIQKTTQENLREQLAALEKAMANMILIAERILSERSGKEKTCTCCGNKVYYKPLSLYYELKIQEYGTRKFIAETLSNDEYECPCCFSSDRDRLMISFLKLLNLNKGEKKESLLQIAPSEAIKHWIYRECPALVYHSTDLYMEDVTFQSDIQNMSQVEDESYDYIICSHVLEHVKDDRKAMGELYRILKKDGFCLFLVPVALDLDETDEEWGLSEKENWKRFGQGDHCRIYNKQGVTKRLEDAGFHVWDLGKKYFGEELFKQNGLSDTSVLYVLTKQGEEIQNQVDIRQKSRIQYRGNKPLVSVILSAYNHEKYVGNTIQSVLDQTYENYEFLAADDGSQDGTAEELLKYKDKLTQLFLFPDNYGGRLPYLSSQAKGKYIAVINSDDTWENDKLEQQVIYLENHPECAACFTGGKCVNENGEVLNLNIFLMENKKKEEWMYHFFCSGNCLAHPSVLIRKAPYCELVVSEVCLFRQLPDYWLWIKLIQKHEIHVIEKELITFLFHEQGNNQNTSARTVENEIRYFNEDAYLWYDTIKKMGSRYFIKAFKPVLRDKKVQNEVDIMCEKYLVLSASHKPQYRLAALFYIYDIYTLPGAADALKNYKIDLKHVYALSGSIAILDSKQIT